MTTCTIEGCARKLAYKGAMLCRRHYDERTDKRAYFQGSAEERFWHYLDLSDIDGCWLWTHTQDGKGYGLVWDAGAGVNRYAHVVAWELDHGEPAGNRVVRHDCDTPLCARGSHMKIGGHPDNVADMVARGRNAKGQSHGLAKLTEDQVIEIRRLYANGAWSQSRLAGRFGVTQSNIHYIVNRNAWTHI